MGFKDVGFGIRVWILRIWAQVFGPLSSQMVFRENKGLGFRSGC